MPRKALLLGAVVAALAMSTDAHAQTFGDRPVVNSFTARDVTTTSARLTASLTYNEKAGSFSFTYCRVSDCAESTVDTPRQDDNPEDDVQAVHPRNAEWPVSDLRPGTAYRVTVHAGNDTHFFDTTDRTFTFSTAAPNVTVVVAPSATTGDVSQLAATTATVSGSVVAGTVGGTSVGSTAFFEYGVNGALDHTTPAQTLPADANPYPLTAPLSGLQPSTQYSYRLVVVRNGQRYPGVTRALRTEWAPNCPQGTTYQTARADRVVATGCFAHDGDRWVADGAVRLNGVLLEPVGTAHAHRHTFAGVAALQSFLDGGNRLYIDKPGRALGSTGTWKMSAQHLIGDHDQGFYSGILDWTGLRWTGDRPLVSLGADRSVDVLDFPLAGELTLTPSADGSSKLGALVSLPVPRLQSVTGEVKIKVNPGGDLALDKLRIEIGALPASGFELGGLKLSYDDSEKEWEGAAEVTLPTASRVKLSADVVIRNRRFTHFEGAVDGLNQHLAYGVYLQRIGVRVGTDPVALGGTIGLTAGPKVAGVGILGVQGDFDVSGAGGRRDVYIPGWGRTVAAYPGSVSIAGTGTIFDIPVRTASATWYFSPTPWFEASTTAGVDIKSGDLTVLRGLATLEGGLYGTSFDIAGELSGVVAGFEIAHANAIAGTQGFGACGSLLGVGSIGAYHAWRGGWNVVDWCSMDQLREAIGHASAASAGAKPLTLPAGHRALVRFAGAGGAPQVRLHGPNGRTIETPGAGATNAAKEGSFLSVRNDKAGQTDVLLTKPGAGWTYETLPGSVPVKAVQTAGELPKLAIRASVHRKGRRAELSWHLGHLAGRRVTFMESGAGAPTRVLAKTTAARGHVRFTTSITAERKRGIVALVEQDGRPRGREVVARYLAPAAPKMTAVKALKLARRGGTAKVRWHKVNGAAKYRLFVDTADGARTMRTVKAPHLTLHGKVRRVMVSAVGADAEVGPARAMK